jgi:hypothetical protein
MKEELYRKVYIKSEADLPELTGDYYAIKKALGIPNKLSLRTYEKDISDNYWINNIDWYLQPPEQSSGKTAEEIAIKHNCIIGTGSGGYQISVKCSAHGILEAMEEYRQQPGKQPTDEEIDLVTWKGRLQIMMKQAIRIGLNDWAILDYCKTFLKSLRDSKIPSK